MPSDAHADPVAIVGGTLLDGNGGPPVEDAVVVIRGERIEAVGGPATPVPEGARRVDATGRYIIPGLMDANVHLFFACTPDDLLRLDDRYEDVVAEAAQVALRSGLTTVFDTWGPRQALLAVRDKIRAGRLEGSRMFVAGNIIGLGGPTSDDFFKVARTVLPKREADRIDERWEQGVGADLLWLTPDEVRERIRRYIDSGSQDFLKYAASGHTEMQFITFSAEAQRAIVEEGHRAGMTVQAHTTSPESLRMEIEAGCDLLQHGDITGPVPMPEATLRTIVDRKIPCASLLTTRRYLAWTEAHGSDPMKTFYRVAHANDRRLVEAGAVVLLTTDAGVWRPDAADHPLIGTSAGADDSPVALGEAHFRWLVAASELGMSPMESLLSATSHIARAYHVDKDLGTLEAGKLADLVILDKDPLASPEHYRNIHLVMQGGRVVDRDSLPSTRVLTA